MLLAGLSTSVFGGVHILALSICIVVAVISLILLKKFKLPLIKLERILLIIGFISESIKVFTYIVINEEEYGGYLPKTDLPFHLCSIQIIFFVILNITKNQGLKKTLYSFMLPTCLVGGIMALLLPTASSRSMPLITIQYFMYHTAISVFAIYLFMTKEVKFTAKDYLICLVMLVATMFIAIYLNSWISDGDTESNINFMYVYAPPMDNLPFLNKNNGWLTYIAHYAGLAITLVTACYIVPIIDWFKNRKKKKA